LHFFYSIATPQKEIVIRLPDSKLMFEKFDEAVIAAAAAAAALQASFSPRITELFCNIAGGQVCERVGVSPVELDALEREYGNVAHK
jgi:hypothetical protein